MVTLRDMLEACDASIRLRLDPDEVVRATGRCEDITDRGTIEAGGAAWTYIMVTNRRIRWVPRSVPRFESSVDLDRVTRAREKTRGHRYAITLDHAPVARLHHVPAHRLLVFGWGNTERVDQFRETRLAFSRADTSAAGALRDELTRRKLLSLSAPPSSRAR